MPPLVSIILPVYNGSRYLPEALASVEGQSLVEWELIVVDDGSTDATPAVLAAAPTDERRRVIHQANAGLAAARNRGLAEAGAPYVAFLDVDDRWRRPYLAELAAALDRAPQAVAAFAGWCCIDEAGTLLPQCALLSADEAGRLATDLYWRNAILPSGLVARRSALSQTGGFDDELAACEDWDMWLRLIGLGSFAAVPHILMEYRVHGTSMTEDVDQIERERLKLNAKHLGSLDEPLEAWPPLRRKAVGYTYFNTALGHLRHKDMAWARDRIERAVRTWPPLAAEDELYYELGCAFQPRGVRGTAVGLSLAEGEAVIHSVLFDWLAADLAPPQRQQAWARANVVLARLARATGQARAARQFAGRAMRLGGAQERWRALRTWARSWQA